MICPEEKIQRIEQKDKLICYAGSKKPLPMLIRSRFDATETIQIRCNIKRDPQKDLSRNSVGAQASSF
jgi:hypothetical protein